MESSFPALLACLPSLGWFIDGGNADEMVMEEGLEDEALAERRGGLRDHGQGGGIDPGGDAGRSERYVRVFCERGPICLVRLPQRMCMLKLSTGLSARFSRLNIRLWLS